jgi:hypothetical protein
MNKEFEECLIVFMGRRYYNHSFFYIWRFYDGDVLSEKTISFDKKNIIKTAYVGAVYKVWISKTKDSVKTGGDFAPVYVAAHPDSEILLDWQVKDKEAELADRIEKDRKSDMSNDEIENILFPIKKNMESINYAGKRRVVAIVLEYLLR